MGIPESTISLYEEMEVKLAEVSSKENDIVQRSRLSSEIVLRYVYKLKSFVSDHKFKSIDEEITFFKKLKPKFLSKLIYHQNVFSIQSNLPLATLTDIRNYYLKELDKINEYFKKNNEFVIYYRSQASSYDEMYFLRKEPDSWLLLNFEDYETDLYFTTVYDHKISKIIAFEFVSEFITSSLAKLEIQRDLSSGQNHVASHLINWTASKVALVELLYAVQSTGSCNNGNIDLKQLAKHFESIFNIDLGNYYRVFQEMRIRKMSRTTFLDQLKERLIQRMDEADENPRFM